MGDLDNPAAIDTLLEDLGGCGLFQVIFFLAIQGSLIPLAWALMFMSFGLYNPGWRCGTYETMSSDLTLDDTAMSRNITEMGYSCVNYSSCENVVYSQDSSTIVTEWDLACDNTYITSFMISMEMGGALLGTLVGGHVCNAIGRKLTHYLTLMANAITHLITAFSVNWQMFAVMQLLNGIAGGFLLVTVSVYLPEFITLKWRGITASLPMWTAGTISFALIAMLLRDWRHLHITSAMVSVFFLVTAYWVHESLRWLAVKGKLEKAVRVGRHIGKLNGNAKTDAYITEVVDTIAREERKREMEKPNIYVFDLYRRHFLKRTIVTSLVWLCTSVVYYTIIFSTKSLSGDFYVNLLLMFSFPIISSPITALTTSTIGRKRSCLLYLGISVVSCLSLFGTHFIDDAVIDKSLVSLVLSLVMIVSLEGLFLVITVYVVELFPTTMRSLGFSHAGFFGKVGAMVAPFLIPIDFNNMHISYLVLAIGMVVAALALMLLPETKDVVMQDATILNTNHTEPSSQEQEMLA